MISLNGVELSNDLIWEDEFNDSGGSIDVGWSITGDTKFIQTATKIKPNTIKLVSRRLSNGYSGFYTREQLIAIKLLENTTATVIFIYEEFTFNVKISSMQVVPLISRPDHENTDLYTGTLTLIEV